VKKNGYVRLLSDLVEDYYWNYISCIEEDLSSILKEARPVFANRQRTLALYMTPDSKIDENNLPANFKKAGVDAWMTLSDESKLSAYKMPSEITIQTVGLSKRDEYVKAFEMAYSSGDPNDPYGNLPSYYSQSLRRSFDYIGKGYKKIYVAAMVGEKIAGVACMLWNRQIAGIYGVGTVHAFRRQGVARSIMAYLYKEAQRNNITTIMLQTEDGSYNDTLYQNMGFTTAFKGTYYTE
jgi:GNAT superfamily N-acetyltransferase